MLNKNKKHLFNILLAIIMVWLFLIPQNILASSITTQKLIELTNQERIKWGLNPFSINPKLTQAAQNKALDMATQKYFSHTTPSGKIFSQWIKEVNYTYEYAGENLAIDFFTAEGIMKAWLLSESHKKNILNPYYTEIGLATITTNWDDSLTTIVVQLFGRPLGAKIESANQSSLLIPPPPVLLTPSVTYDSFFQILNQQIQSIRDNLPISSSSLAGIIFVISFISLITHYYFLKPRELVQLSLF